MRNFLWMAAILVFIVPGELYAVPLEIKGKVVDEEGNGVAGVKIGYSWSVKNDVHQNRGGSESWTTDENGDFTGTTKYGLSNRGFVLMAFDEKQERGGLVWFKTGLDPLAIRIVLTPLVTIKGKVDCTELGRPPSWAEISFYMPGQYAKVSSVQTRNGSFSIKLPPGAYRVRPRSRDEQSKNIEIEIPKGKAEYTVETIDMEASQIARHIGKAPPVWNVTDARGLEKTVKLKDFKGKWLLIEFWGYW